MDNNTKLLFFDIDGTLSMVDEHVSDVVRDAIRQARKNGHLAFLSTGRTELIVPDEIKAIGFDGGIYSAGGKVVIHNKTVSDNAMPEKLTREIIAILQKYKNMFFTLECSTGNFHGNLKNLDLNNVNLKGASTELQRVVSIMMKDSQRLVEDYNGEPIYKVSYFATSDAEMTAACSELAQIGKVVRFDNMFKDIEFFSSEVIANGFGKGIAIKQLCEYLNADISQTIAFGDSMNDYEMIKTAGLGVAMGNAEDRIKAIADVICESCADDGIAKELKRLNLI